MSSIAIMQPYLFPYIGYFQLFKAADVFVYYDDAQYMKGGWINRNKILFNGVPKFISFPVRKDSISVTICNRIFSDNIGEMKKSILSVVKHAYSRAGHFESVYPVLAEILRIEEDNVARFAEYSVRKILEFLAISVHSVRSSKLKYDRTLKGQDRVISIVRELGGKVYINPIGGLELYSPIEFQKKGINLLFLKCIAEPYKQFTNEFVPNLSIIDVLMFNSTEQVQRMLKQYSLI